MYSDDPRNRKAPSILLGFIAITGALILALFLTGILKAHAEEPSFENYNYVTFIRVEGQICSFVDSQGHYLGDVPTIHNDSEAALFGAALDNLSYFVDFSSSIAVLIDDYAAAGPYNYIKNELASRHVSLIEDSSPINYDVSGFNLKQYPAGMWNAYLYDRSVPLTPTPSPSPTPTSSPSEEEYFFVSLPGYGYVCLTFTCSNFNAPIQQTLQNNNMLSGIMTEFNTGDIFENGPIFIAGSKYSRSSLYFSGSNVVLGNWYSLGSSIPNTSLEYIKNNYTANSGNTIQLYSLTLSSSLSPVNDLNCIYVEYMYSSNYVSTFVEGGSFNVINVTPQLSSRSNNTFIVSSYDNTYPMYYVYKYGLNSEENENPNPTPSPTAAPPTPTEAPHVIINWPSGTPTPTPPFSVPGNSGTGSGSSGSGSLSPGQIDSTLDTFKTYTENNNAFAFLYACTSVIPDEALYFLFILLFILILLACIRLFVHFTG